MSENNRIKLFHLTSLVPFGDLWSQLALNRDLTYITNKVTGVCFCLLLEAQYQYILDLKHIGFLPDIPR